MYSLITFPLAWLAIGKKCFHTNCDYLVLEVAMVGAPFTQDAQREGKANGTCCCQWECSHCLQATSKEKRSNLCVRRVARPVWIRPGHSLPLPCSLELRKRNMFRQSCCDCGIVRFLVGFNTQCALYLPKAELTIFSGERHLCFTWQCCFVNVFFSFIVTFCLFGKIISSSFRQFYLFSCWRTICEVRRKKRKN